MHRTADSELINYSTVLNYHLGVLVLVYVLREYKLYRYQYARPITGQWIKQG